MHVALLFLGNLHERSWYDQYVGIITSREEAPSTDHAFDRLKKMKIFHKLIFL